MSGATRMITATIGARKRPVRGRDVLSTRRAACLCCLIFLIMNAFGPSASPAQSSDRPPRAVDLLPAAAELKSWTASGRPEVYQGEALYEYIDGGAEIYREYGFQEVAVQDYKNRAGHTVTLEVYVMASPHAAYGIFTFKTTGKGRAMGWRGVEGEIEAYYLNLWRGPVLVTITGLDESPETLAGVIGLGRATAARLNGPLGKPTLVKDLPPKGLRAGSTKYFRGRLGLNNIRVLFPGRGFPFVEGVRGLYEDGSELYIFATGSVEEARAALNVAREAARADDDLLGVYKAKDESFVLRDGTATLRVDRVGRFVLVARSVSADRAAELTSWAAPSLAGR